MSWFLVNRGSKFWQNNLERHADLLEDSITGPLYKTVIQTGELKFLSISKEYNYSVSKLNQILSFYVTVIWLGMGLYYYTKHLGLQNTFDSIAFLNSPIFKSSALLLLTSLATWHLIMKGQSDSVKQNTDKTLRIKVRKPKYEEENEK